MSNSKIKYKVYLSERQRQQLRDISHNGHGPAKKILHAQVLLMADQDHPEAGWSAYQHNCYKKQLWN
ncbi:MULTISPECIES: hypothetical protein [Okeania]|uniref:Uncharacterized protein n=2 Tax=Microcoleaceae TaxID=1892252 RepID=A0A3N6P4A5_9CYAN|nr:MULTISPECIES: hypothetical protein [Okeania]NES76078.1 hypothetical protein [Okeania sp. SIO1H4]NET21489.1 hypothetical protein [Okeania sp. SIO1H5]NET94282.1 hypothetical protein [Okeania sp. SIO1H2]RQH21661.1 hypothetical protein D5R40_31380 [Okeania hirsuta]RQH37028.1 hypothetical protein D5R40_18665 [Okeania hirsuta]